MTSWKLQSILSYKILQNIDNIPYFIANICPLFHLNVSTLQLLKTLLYY